MRILGIETSTRRGSVALVEDERLVAHRQHEEPNAHAERLLPLVSELFAESGWEPSSIDRIAVGIGPGSFTGVRVGMALAQGIALGLGVPVVGIPSLRAMARAVPDSVPHPRLACLDARRDEIFVEAVPPGSVEPAAPRVVPRAGLSSLLAELLDAGPVVVVGEVADELGLAHAPGMTGPHRSVRHASPDADLPDARWVAELGRHARPAPTLEPLYVRGADAVLPATPPDALVHELEPSLGAGRPPAARG